jgi:lipopolysaccharide biosynthesis glycosyltransferase
LDQTSGIRHVVDASASLSRIPSYLTSGARFAGAVDYVEAAAGIRGWLIDTAAPGTPAVIELVSGSVRLARAHAMMDRPDIDEVAGRLTQCGFLIGWSWFDVKALTQVARDVTSDPLEFVVAETGERVRAVCEIPRAAALLGLVFAAPLGGRQPAFRESSDYREVVESGLFDTGWYRARMGSRLDPGMPAALDYLRRGEAAGERPNFYFDPVACATEWDLNGPTGALLHYIRAGGGTHLPGIHFDERWYRRRHEVPRGERPLAHYLAHRPHNAPNAFFDVSYYLKASGEPHLTDPYAHFVTTGFVAGLMPSERLAAGARGASLPPGAALYLAGLRRQAGLRDAPADAMPVPPAKAPLAVRPELAATVPPSAAPPCPAAAAPEAVPASLAPAEPPAPEAAPAPISLAASERLPPAPATPAGPAVPGDPTLPPAAQLGYEATAAWLASLSAEDLATAVAAAEAGLAGAASARADAALVLAVARQAAGQPEQAAEAAATYFATPVALPSAVAEPTADRLLHDAHRVYEQFRRDAAAPVYRSAYEAGRRDYLVLLRLIEVALDGGEVRRVVPVAAEFEARFGAPLDAWAAIVLSKFHHADGNVARGTRLLLGVPTFPAIDALVEATLLHRLVEMGAVEDAAARSEVSAADESADLFGARFRIAVKRRDAPALLAAVADRRAAELPGWQLAEAMFQLSEAGALTAVAQVPVLRALNKLAEARGIGEGSVVQARIQYLMHGKRWDELGALFERLDGSPLGQDREILLRRLEFYCHADNAEAAERIYREGFRDTALNKWEGLTVMRLLSELKRWDEAAAALQAHAARGFGFGGAGHIGMRIVRKAGIHEAVIAAAEGAATHEPDLLAFVARVREDLAILQTARTLSANREMVARGSRYRSNWILDAGANEAEEQCVFVCTNQRYFLSMLTFLCSYLGQAPQAGGRIFAFLDRDVPRHWHGAVAMVAARFGRSIEVVMEHEFVPDTVEHRVEYGFFAGGSNLSRAAYFRLYAARWLLQRHSFRRAAYIDTDTICRADLSGLFSLEFGDRLIAAATEDYSPDVVNAASRNDLDPYAYFNSGVLLLRFDDAELPAYIEEAIRVSEQEPDRLVFHDQCALNIAFQGRVAILPTRYNFFLRPSRDRNGYVEDGVILHFLDKPKPWDIVFDRSYREEWRVWALILGSILPQSLYVDIFAEANRD